MLSSGVVLRRLLFSVVAAAWAFGAPLESRAQVLISEFQAINTSTLLDENNESSDWIELLNVSEAPVSLEGWALTDDVRNLQKWIFPAVEIQPGGYLVVFASGKDRRDPESELHTNFRLTGMGEPLFLLDATREVISGFPPAFPVQLDDASYGVSTDSTFFSFVAGEDPVRALVPTDDSLGLDWIEPAFDDSVWRMGPGGVGLERSSGFEDFIGIDVEAEMHDINATVYIRIPFTIEGQPALDTLRLQARYDDGFVAFLNGVRVAEANVPDEGELAWNSSAGASHSDRLATQYERFDISEHIGLLVSGENWLAIQGLNTSDSSNDALFQFELEGIELGEVQEDELLYFAEPTPGEPNGPGFSEIAPLPEFSHDSGSFVESQMVSLSTGIPGAEIRFTVNGGTPDETSELYETPIEVDSAVEIRARVFADGLLPGPTGRRTYIVIDSGVQSVSSNIPIVVVNTFGRPIPNNCEGAYTPGYFSIFEPGEDGRARLTDAPSFAHSSGFRRRGSSTCGRQKFSFNVETRDAEGEEVDSVMFDWPAHGDYAMYGPFNFDRALIRNALIYELSRQVGRYAVRTRFVECYLHTRVGPVTSSSYWGVYVLMERNKRGEGRIDVERLGASANSEPEISGGYIVKVDRADGAVTVSGGGLNVVMVHPKVPTAQQRTWLSQYMGRVRASLDPDTVIEQDGELIDVGAWIDHHILNVYPKNVDAFRLSGYMFKDREGPMHMGPIWDYDRTMGNADDGRASDPFSWANTGGDGGTMYFAFGWYGPLFRNQPPVGSAGNTAWGRAYRARWRELRSGALSNENVLGLVDSMAAELSESAERNVSRWPQVRGRFGGFQGEINHLRNWLRDRGNWMDSQFVEPPRFSDEGGPIDPGFELEITVDGEGVEIWYTIDGEDPRDGELPSATATLYTGPIVINENTIVRARSREGSLWSGIAEATFVTGVPALTISELMYNPLSPTLEEDPDDRFSGTSMEYIELKNIGDEPIDLHEGFRFGSGVLFDFNDSAIQMLQPGEVVLVVQNLEAFEARYGSGLPVAGQYRGSFSNTAETITVTAALDVAIFSFRYDDDWYPETDGEGPSLENTDPENNTDLNEATSWRASEAPLGTPGVSGSPPAGGLHLPSDYDGNGRLAIGDASSLLLALFAGQVDSLPCAGPIDSASNVRVLDADGSGAVNLNDAVRVLQFIFQSGQPPALGRECVRILGCEDGAGACAAGA